MKNRAASRSRDEAGRSILVFEVEIDTEGSSQRFCVEHDAKSYAYIGYEDYVHAMPLTPGVRSANGYYLGPASVPLTQSPQPPSSFPAGDEQTDVARVFRSEFVEGYGESVVNQAMEVVSNLLASFPVDAWQILMFLLTDAVPDVVPIRALLSSYDYHLLDNDSPPKFIEGFWADGGITLHVQPWVQPESLARHWRGIRGSTKRLPKKEALEMFTFALMNTKPGEDFRWQALANQWQEGEGRALGDNPRDTIRKAVIGTRETLFPNLSVGTIPPDEV